MHAKIAYALTCSPFWPLQMEEYWDALDACRGNAFGLPRKLLHVHHGQPRFAGGGDDPSNLYSLLSVLHYEAHTCRFRLLRQPQDAAGAQVLRGGFKSIDVLSMATRDKMQDAKALNHKNQILLTSMRKVRAASVGWRPPCHADTPRLHPWNCRRLARA